MKIKLLKFIRKKMIKNEVLKHIPDFLAKEKIFSPVLERSNTPSVNSAKAIDKGVFPTLFLAPYSKENRSKINK